jgi:hypothetical protein
VSSGSPWQSLPLYCFVLEHRSHTFTPQGTLNGIFIVVLLLEILYLALTVGRMQSILIQGEYLQEPILSNKITWVFFTRAVLILVAILFLFLLQSYPVEADEQVRAINSDFAHWHV